MITAYGSITVSGLTDIADIYFEYSLAVSSANVTNDYPFTQAGELGWTVNGESRKTPPTWQSGYKIWVREVKIKTDVTTKFYGNPYPDTAINQTNVDLEALQTKVKKMWSNSTGSYMASGIGNNEVDIGNSSTYGFNSKITTTGISFNYNNYKTIELDGSIPALKFYEPSKTSQGTQIVQIDSNGMKLLKGGIEAGEAGQTGFIYLSTEDYPLKDTQSSPTVAGLTINEYTPSAAGTDEREIDDPAWRQIIGTKFGVDSEGNLYASDVNIKGKITATSGEIGGAQIENGRLIIPYSNISFLSTDKIRAENLDLSSKLDTNDGSGGQASWNNGVFTVSSFSSTNQTQYSIEISGTGIKFKYNDIESASIDQDKLIIGKTVVLDEMQVGTNKWTWKINPFDNSIYLKWLG